MGSLLIVSLTVSSPSPSQSALLPFELTTFGPMIFTSYDRTIGVNRLDRLTSGLMILATTGKASTGLAQEFIKGHVKKEYLARVRGRFPE